MGIKPPFGNRQLYAFYNHYLPEGKIAPVLNLIPPYKRIIIDYNQSEKANILVYSKILNAISITESTN